MAFIAVKDQDIDLKPLPAKKFVPVKDSDIQLVPSSMDPMRAIADKMKSTDDVLQKLPGAVGKMATEAGNTANGVISQLTGRNKDADYMSGLPYGARVAFKSADNDAERRAALESFYPKENITRDSKGNWLVKTDKGILEVEGTHSLENALASLQAHPGEAVGATLGGSMGFASPLPGGAAVGAGLGGAAGYNVDELIKVMRGVQRKTPGELAKETGVSGATNAAADLGGTALKNVFTEYLGPGIRRFIGSTPETQELTKKALDMGASPPISSFAPEAKASQFHQALSEKVAGSFIEKKNAAALKNKAGEVLGKGGVSAGISKESLGKEAEAQAGKFGAAATVKASDYAANLDGMAKKGTAIAHNILDDQLRNIKSAVGKGEGKKELGVDVAKGFETARKDFGDKFNTIYKGIDQQLGKTPVVPMLGVQRAAQRLLKTLPKDVEGNPIFADEAVLKRIKALGNTPEKMSISDAQAIRHELGRLALNPDLTPGVTERHFNILREAVDTAIGNAAKDPAVAPAIKALRTADRAYGDGIKKFDLRYARDIVKNVRAGVIPDAATVAKELIGKNYRSEAAQLKGMLPPPAWRRIAAQDFKNIMAAATEDTGEVNAKKLLRAVESHPMLDLVYGKDAAAETKLYARRLAAKNGAFPTTKLDPDNFVRALKTADKAATKMDSFLKDNYIAALAKPEAGRFNVFDWMVKPGNTDRLEKAVKFYGDNSDVVKQMRKTALLRAFEAGTKTTVKQSENVIDGKALQRHMQAYSPREKEILFPGGMAKDIEDIARMTKFLFPESKDTMAAGLAAGAIKMALPFGAVGGGYAMGGAAGAKLALATYVGVSLYGFLAARPSMIRLVALGLKGDSKALAAADQAYKLWLQSEASDHKADSGEKEPLPQPNAP